MLYTYTKRFHRIDSWVQTHLALRQVHLVCSHYNMLAILSAVTNCQMTHLKPASLIMKLQWSRRTVSILWLPMPRHLSSYHEKPQNIGCHYNDVIMNTMVSQITSPTIVYWIVYSDADQRKHQSPASLAFVRGIHRGPVDVPHKWPVTRKMFPFDDVIMY